MKRVPAASVRATISFLFILGLIVSARGASPAQTPAAASGTPAPNGAASNAAPEQPIPFSHKKHSDFGLVCSSCHTNPAPGVDMTIAGTAKCMVCHATTEKDKPSIKLLTKYNNEHQPVPWVQVYSVPALAFWSHQTHLEAKVECAACHGDVAQMETMRKVTDVTTMAGCEACHTAKDAPTGCLVCHELQLSRLTRGPLPAWLRGKVAR